MWNLVLYLKRKLYICQESNIGTIGAIAEPNEVLMRGEVPFVDPARSNKHF